MAKQIKQIRWFDDNDSRNYPSTMSAAILTDREYFEQFSPILQLSIHTLPGVKVYFNDQDEDPIFIGHSGVYQLDLQDTSAVLWGLHFAQDDLTDIKKTNVGLIIDIMYANEAEDDSDAETETTITSTSGMASVNVSTHIKNVHKNIWYGVNDKISPLVLERDSQLEKLKADFAEMLRKLKDKYQSTLNQLNNLDPNDFAANMANCTACYEKCLREIIDYYTEAIAELEGEEEGHGLDNNDFNIELAQGFRGASTTAAVSQKALYDLIGRINSAFNSLSVNTTHISAETIQSTLENKPNIENLLGPQED